MTTTKPTFIHDCDRCIYLGQEFDGEMLEPLDLYVHVHATSWDLIRRWGDRGEQYGCMPVAPDEAPAFPSYRKAFELAQGVLDGGLPSTLAAE